MTDLASWLLALIADDEAAARLALSARWSVIDGTVVFRQGTTDTVIVKDAAAQIRDLEHIARHDPARVLADCAAKRKVVDVAHRMILDASDEGNDMLMKERVLTFRSAQIILTALAQPYADRPGFDPAWKVET